MSTGSSSPNPWPAGIAVVVFVLATFFAGGDPVDDAGITYRYARNLAAGQGLCFNPGERVEGYVHFLWIVILAAVERLTGILPMEAGPGLGRIFGALSVIWVALLAGLFSGGRRWIRHFAPWLLATNLYFILWSQAGLETPLFTWLALVALHLAGKGGPAATLGAPLVLVALCTTRPEGILVALALGLDTFVRHRRLDLRAARVCLAFVIPAGVYFLWRWTYFGCFLPNVFYAKAQLGWWIGLNYLLDFLIRNEARILLPLTCILLLLLCTGIPILAAVPGLVKPPHRVLSLLIILWTAGVVYEGGDWMGAFRFLVPLLPVFALVATAAAGHLHLGGRIEKGLAVALLAAPLAFNGVNGVLYGRLPPNDPCRTWFHQRGYYDDMASWVKQHVPPGSLLALGDMGYIPYETPDRRYIDFMGLVDATIAHLPGGLTNPNVYLYINQKKPAYFLSLVHRNPEGKVRGHTPVDHAMLGFLDPALPEDQRIYVKVADIEGWVEKGDLISFYVYRRAK